jgi:tellurite resistance protein TerC
MALFWIGFILLVIVLLAIDLGVFNKEAHVVTTAEALRWTTVWVTISLLFSIFIYFAYQNQWLGESVHIDSGKQAVLTYLTGYLVEQSLSVDNIFVIAVIFTYFRIPAESQHAYCSGGFWAPSSLGG